MFKKNIVRISLAVALAMLTFPVTTSATQQKKVYIKLENNYKTDNKNKYENLKTSETESIKIKPDKNNTTQTKDEKIKQNDKVENNIDEFTTNSSNKFNEINIDMIKNKIHDAIMKDKKLFHYTYGDKIRDIIGRDTKFQKYLGKKNKPYIEKNGDKLIFNNKDGALEDLFETYNNFLDSNCKWGVLKLNKYGLDGKDDKAPYSKNKNAKYVEKDILKTFEEEFLEYYIFISKSWLFANEYIKSKNKDDELNIDVNKNLSNSLYDDDHKKGHQIFKEDIINYITKIFDNKIKNIEYEYDGNEYKTYEKYEDLQKIILDYIDKKFQNRINELNNNTTEEDISKINSNNKNLEEDIKIKSEDGIKNINHYNKCDISNLILEHKELKENIINGIEKIFDHEISNMQYVNETYQNLSQLIPSYIVEKFKEKSHKHWENDTLIKDISQDMKIGYNEVKELVKKTRESFQRQFKEVEKIIEKSDGCNPYGEYTNPLNPCFFKDYFKKTNIKEIYEQWLNATKNLTNTNFEELIDKNFSTYSSFAKQFFQHGKINENKSILNDYIVWYLRKLKNIDTLDMRDLYIDYLKDRKEGIKGENEIMSNIANILKKIKSYSF